MNIIVIFAIIVIILALLLKSKAPFLIGRMGEIFVNRRFNKLDPTCYKILSNLLLPSRGHLNTTQIDQLVISNFGIFCVETKSYKGWIFGNASQEYWTQVIYRYKKRFYNPLRQNYAHVKAIEEVVLSRYPKARIFSLVAFPYADKIQISGTDMVGYTRDVISKIESFNTPVLSDAERDAIYDMLVHANIQNREMRKVHDRGVRDLKK